MIAANLGQRRDFWKLRESISEAQKLDGVSIKHDVSVPVSRVPELIDRSWPPLRFVFPNAPVMPVTINNGYPMPAWYDIFGPIGGKGEDEAGLRRSMASIEALIATGAIAQASAIDVMPTSILFDRDGNVSTVHKGFRLERREEYESHVVALLQGGVAGAPATAAAPAPPGKHRLGVRPWQRGILSQRDMRLDSDPLDLATDDHIYFSKEASSGGRSFGGGGCGCN